MTSKLRLRDFTGLMLLVGTGMLGVGCSSMSGSRFRPAEGSRSVASVGDQPLPPSVGSPGSQVASDVPEPEPYRNPKARIAGRVVDSQGRPVSGATVRLADGSRKAGLDVQTTTDASGGFTLGGLRPGSAYYLVAEANFGDEQGTVTGRAQADTSETGVQIRLGDANDDAAPVRPSKLKAPKSRAISERADGELEQASPKGVNDEDLGPPAEAADLIAQPEPRKPKKGSNPPDRKGSDAASGWRRPGAEPDLKANSKASAEADSQPDSEEPVDLDPGPRSTRPRPEKTPPQVDSDNPLPLALPPKAKSSDRADDSPARPISRKVVKPRAKVVPRVEPEDDPDLSGGFVLGANAEATDDRSTALAEADGSTSSPKPMPSLMDLADSNPSSRPDPPQILNLNGVPGLMEPLPPGPLNSEDSLLALNTSPAGSTPGELVLDANAESNKTGAEPFDPSAHYNPFALVAPVPLEPSRPRTPEPSISSPQPNPVSSPENSVSSGEASTPKPRKWADLAQDAPAVVGGAVAGTTGAVAATETPRPNVLLARRSRATSSAKPDAEALSQFDSKQNRLVDFQLPDLDGQPVRFRDFDADYVLLDFWGTWCEPCLDSIPHLIELQKQYGANKLKVVGIACEKTSADRRKALVAAAAEKLGINYSVLITSMDGDCPVQRDFQVRFYPTMILLDRRGKIVWRAEGATPSNMYRLDRALAATERPTQTARR